MDENLESLKDTTAKRAFGITRQEAWNLGVCIKCAQKPEFYSYEGRKEYGITALCEFCFDLICDPDTCSLCDKPESWHTYKRVIDHTFKSKPSDYIGN